MAKTTTTKHLRIRLFFVNFLLLFIKLRILALARVGMSVGACLPFLRSCIIGALGEQKIVFRTFRGSRG